MLKNIIILFLLACLLMLFYNDNSNVDVIKDNLVDGTTYLKKTFTEKEPFSEGSGFGIEEETFHVEEDKE